MRVEDGGTGSKSGAIIHLVRCCLGSDGVKSKKVAREAQQKLANELTNKQIARGSISQQEQGLYLMSYFDFQTRKQQG